MSVEIELVTKIDEGQVNAALDRIAANARNKPVTLNVQAGGGGPTGTVNPPGTIATPGSNAPTATGVLAGTTFSPVWRNWGAMPPNVGASVVDVAAAFRAAGGMAGGGFPIAAVNGAAMAQVTTAAAGGGSFWNNVAALGQSAPPPGFWGGGGGGLTPPPLASPVRPPANGGPGLMARISRGALDAVGQYGGLGFVRFVAAGEFARIGVAGYDYQNAMALAGTDQRAFLKAEQDYQKAVGGFFIAGPFADFAANYIADAGGYGRTATNAVARSAELADQRRARIADTAEFTQRLGERAGVFGARGSFSRESARLDVEYEQASRNLRARKTEYMDAERAEVQAGVIADLTSNPQRVTERWKRDYPDVAPGDWNATQEATRQQIVSEETAKTMAARERAYNARYYYPALASLGVVRAEQRRELELARNVDLQGMNRAGQNAALRARGFEQQAERNTIFDEYEGRIALEQDPERKAALRDAGRAALRAFDAAAARARGFHADDLFGSAEVNRRVLARDPLGARVHGIDLAEQRAMRDVENTSAEATAIRKYFQSERDVAKQEDDDAKRYRQMELAAQGGALQLAVEGRPAAGRAYGAAEGAIRAATILREQQNDPDNANLVIRNAILEQRAMKKQLLATYDAIDFDPQTMAVNAARAGEDDTKYLSSIDDNIQRLLSAFTTGGGAGAYTTE